MEIRTVPHTLSQTLERGAWESEKDGGWEEATKELLEAASNIAKEGTTGS